MPKTRQQKIDAVVKLKEKLLRAKAFVFADYKGLSMSQLSALRKMLREVNGEFAITKNALLERALPASNLQLPVSRFDSRREMRDERAPLSCRYRADP